MTSTAEPPLPIAHLASASAKDRENAARAIFRRGCELADPATASWFADLEFARCVALGRSGVPELTVGIAVRPENFEKIHVASGSPPLASVPPGQDAREFEIELPGGVRLDVLTTTGLQSGGAIARFLERSGEGIQQVEIEVTDVDRATEILRARFGISPIYPATRPGANAARINFFLVPVAVERKVLIELVESPRSSPVSV